MQELTYVGPGKVEWREAAEPKLQGPGEALVEPLTVATCDLDPLLVQGRTPYPPPIALGHESIARVIEIGDDVERTRPGDVVAVPFQISCGDCEKCRRGQTGNCASVPFLSMYGFGKLGGEWGGALSDRMRVPYADHMLVPVSAQTDPVAVASLSDNIVDGWRTVAPELEREPGSEVLIMGGAGSIGMYAAGIAAALGAERVDYVDSDEDRLARAKKLGANVLETLPDGSSGSYPVAVDAAGDPEGLRAALRATAPDGTCTSIGIYFEETDVPLLEMYTRGITFRTGRVHARHHMEEALALIETNRFSPEVVTSRVIPWGEADEAIAQERGKLVFSRL